MEKCMKENEIKNNMYQFASDIFPICRSLTGPGVRETLGWIKKYLPTLEIHEVKTGVKAFDWTIPPEWIPRAAYIITPDGRKICNFENNNLHLVGYSHAVNKSVTLKQLQEHLHSLPHLPNAIPYVTSYYERNWGFCIADEERKSLREGKYQVFIDSELIAGSLSYGEIYLPGKSSDEIFLSTYICHPSMANNEVSGPVVLTFLLDFLMRRKNKKMSYRAIFIPETIGSIVYLSKNLNHMRRNIKAGFNITCVGDDRAYSFLPSRAGNTLSDKVARHVLKYSTSKYIEYSWSERGSDERQYCAPGVDLPISSMMRSKYRAYPEYHTSLDKLGTVVTKEGLYGGYEIHRRALEAIEGNGKIKSTILCEPQMSSRNLYPKLSTSNKSIDTKRLMNILTWSDGSRDVIEIAELCDLSIWELLPYIEILVEESLIEYIS